MKGYKQCPECKGAKVLTTHYCVPCNGYGLISIKTKPKGKSKMNTTKQNITATAGTGGKPELPAFEIFLSGGTSYVTSMARGTTLEKARKYFLDESMEQPDGSYQRCTDVKPVLTTHVIEECYDALSGLSYQSNNTQTRQDFRENPIRTLTPPSDQPHKRQESAHTPGPWKSERISVRYGCYGYEVTHSEPRSNMPPQPQAWDRRIAFLNTDDDETRANARLIAAAPSLLAALKLAVVTLEGVGVTLQSPNLHKVTDKLVAAIAGAESQTRRGEKGSAE